MHHLESDKTDPFNRQPLSDSEIVPAEELKARIRDWAASFNLLLSTPAAATAP